MPKKSNVDIKPPERKPSPSAVEKIGMPHPDKVRLDFLQKLTDEGRQSVIMRWSTTNRGWRLHETSLTGAVQNVRKAIDNFMEAIGATEE